ncbi:hypothetical protein HQ576_03785 [bacterium]|nr:hypothetical protein [bacterium]
MRRLAVVVLLAALAAPAAGGSALATAGQVLWAPFRYVGGRVGDLFDIFDLNLGVGAGAKADVKYAVNFLGAGHVDAVRFGLTDGTLDLWQEKDREVGLFPFSLIGWPAHIAGRVLNNPRLSEDAIKLAVAHSLGTQTVDRQMLAREGAVVFHDVLRMWRHTTWGNSLPVGAEFHAGLVGVRVAAKPFQVLDFGLGFVGIDLDPWLRKRPF